MKVGPVKLSHPLSDHLQDYCDRHGVDRTHAVRIAVARLALDQPPSEYERDLRGVVGNPRAREAALARWRKEFGQATD